MLENGRAKELGIQALAVCPALPVSTEKVWFGEMDIFQTEA